MNQEPLDLSLDLTNLKTTFPVLVAGIKDLRVGSITKEENKAKNGFNLVISLETTEPDVDLDGNTMVVGSPGTKLKHYLPLQPNAENAQKEGFDKDGWRKRIAAFQDACLNTTTGTRPPNFVASDLIGKIIRCNVEAKAGDNGQMQNNIKSMSYPT